MDIVRNVEVWIFGSFVALVVAACLIEPAQGTAPPGSVPAGARLAPPDIASPPMHVVHVTGKRLSAAEKRALRAPG